jgi:GNAT superfamily N-acetyltransferase
MARRRLRLRRIVTDSKPVVAIRYATEGDIPKLIALIALIALITAHAAHEHAPINDDAGLHQRLLKTLTSRSRATCLVAVSDRIDDETLVGYLTFSPEYSTWAARDYVHMDTLFVDERVRGYGIGELLFNSMVALASMSDFDQIQRQTPDWNIDAIRFYDRLGAQRHPKVRFDLPIALDPPRPTHLELLDVFTEAWAAGNTSVLRSCLHPDVSYFPSVAVTGAPFIGVDAVLGGIAIMREHDRGSVPELGPALESPESVTRTWAYHFAHRPSEHGVDVFTFFHGLILRKDAFRRQSSLFG